jgi:hypothetical protein
VHQAHKTEVIKNALFQQPCTCIRHTKQMFYTIQMVYAKQMFHTIQMFQQPFTCIRHTKQQNRGDTKCSVSAALHVHQAHKTEVIKMAFQQPCTCIRHAK